MKHPDMCYVLIMGTEVGIIKWKENGYNKTDYPSGYTQEDVDHFNEKLGVSNAEAHAIKMCSMANLPETDEAWEKHYQMCIDIYEKHEKETKEKI